MNITLAIDEQLAERARAVAAGDSGGERFRREDSYADRVR